MLTRLFPRFLLFFLLVSWATPATAQVAPPFAGVRLQGSFADLSGNPMDGLFTVTIRIYKVATGGSPVYAESFSNLLVSNGALNLLVGAGQGTSSDSLVAALAHDPADATYERYLTMQFEGDAQEFLPRRRITASLVAAVAMNAQLLGGQPAATYVTGSQLSEQLTGFAQLGDTNTFQPAQPNATPVVVQAATGQTANLLEIRDSSGAVITSVSPSGVWIGDGSGLSHLNASNLATGTVAAARGGLGFDASAVPTGSVLYASGPGTWAALPAGDNGQVLKLVGGVPGWGTDETATGGGGGVTQLDEGTGLTFSANPIVSSGTISIDTTVVPRLGAANVFSTGGQTIETGGAAIKGLIVKGAAGQAANLQEWQDNAGSVAASIGPSGTIAAAGFAGSGSGLTNLNASELVGTIPPARGGTGADTSGATQGTLLFASGSGGWSSLPAGTTGQVLKMSASGSPEWGADEVSTGGGSVNLTPGTGISLTPTPITSAGAIGIDTAVVPRLAASNVFTGTQTVSTGAVGAKGILIKRVAGQTANLQEWQDESGTPVASVSAAGALEIASLSTSGAITAGSISGNGAGVTNLNAANLASGTVSTARGGLGVDLSGAPNGAVLYKNASGVWTPLTAGTPGQVLKVSGTSTPTWGTDNTGGGTGVTEISQGSGIILTPSPINSTGSVGIDTTVVPRLSANNVFAGSQTFQSDGAASQAVVVQGASSQTADLQQWQDQSGAVMASVGAAGVVSGVSFSGSGSGLTNLNASNLGSGTVAINRGGTGATSASAARSNLGAAAESHGHGFADISGNLPSAKLSGTYSSSVNLTNSSNSFTGDGSGLTGITVAASDITSGTLPITRGGTGASSAGSALVNLGAAAASHGHTFSDVSGNLPSSKLSGTYSSAVTLSSASNSFNGSGAGLTGLSASNISSGTLSDSRLSTNVCQLGSAQTITAPKTIWMSSNTVGLVVRDGTSQTVDLQQWQSSGGSVLASVTNAGVFTGNGSGLTNITVDASDITSGTVPISRGGTGATSATAARTNLDAAQTAHGHTFTDITGNLPSSKLSGTYSSAVTLSSASNSFAGSGASLTGLSATNITTGTLSDSRLSAEVCQLSLAQTFTGAKTFQPSTNTVGLVVREGSTQTVDLQRWLNSSGTTLASVSNTGVFTGDGSGLTGITVDATDITSGILPSARLSGTYSNALTFSNASNSFAGSGASLTGLSATNITAGTLSDSRLSADVCQLSLAQTFTGAKTFQPSTDTTALIVREGASQTGDLQRWLNSSGTTLARVSNSGTFYGSGIGLSSLNASNLTSGTVPSARFSGTYSNAVTFSNTSNSFVGSGTSLTALNATQLTAGTLPSARFSGTYSSAVTLSSASNSFSGIGTSLTALNATQLTTGTLPSGRFSGTYSSAVTLSNSSNNFTGNGGGLTDIGAYGSRIPTDGCILHTDGQVWCRVSSGSFRLCGKAGDRACSTDPVCSANCVSGSGITVNVGTVSPPAAGSLRVHIGQQAAICKIDLESHTRMRLELRTTVTTLVAQATANNTAGGLAGWTYVNQPLLSGIVAVSKTNYTIRIVLDQTGIDLQNPCYLGGMIGTPTTPRASIQLQFMPTAGSL